MPTYDYECSSCGHSFEIFQTISEPVKRKCPDCGKLRLKRLFGAGAGLIFKGSGFYITDYRSDSYKAAEKAETGSASKSDAKSDAKSDSKTGTARDSTPASAAGETASKGSAGGSEKKPVKPAAD